MSPQKTQALLGIVSKRKGSAHAAPSDWLKMKNSAWR
jgi:hypothetical protein